MFILKTIKDQISNKSMMQTMAPTEPLLGMIECKWTRNIAKESRCCLLVRVVMYRMTRDINAIKLFIRASIVSFWKTSQLVSLNSLFNLYSVEKLNHIGASNLAKLTKGKRDWYLFDSILDSNCFGNQPLQKSHNRWNCPKTSEQEQRQQCSKVTSCFLNWSAINCWKEVACIFLE